MKKNKFLFYVVLTFLSYNINAQNKISFYYDSANSFYMADCHSIGADTVTFEVPNDEYLNKLIEVVDDVITSRSIEAHRAAPYRYLFPIYIKCKNEVRRVITTASGLYYFYSKENQMTVHDFRSYLFKVLKHNDTIEFKSFPFIDVSSLCFTEINYCEPEFMFFRQNRWAFVNHFFYKSDGISFFYYVNGRNKVGAVVEQVYSWGILVTDGGGNCDPILCYITPDNYPDLSDSKKKYNKEKFDKWDDVFSDFILDGGKIIKKYIK